MSSIHPCLYVLAEEAYPCLDPSAYPTWCMRIGM
jgi:hypothetical protein